MDFLKYRYVYFFVSGVLALISIFLLIFGKLNLGIDMTGGINVDYSYTNNIDIEKVREELDSARTEFKHDGQLVVNNINSYTITGEKTISIVIGFRNVFDEKIVNDLKTDFSAQVKEIILKNDSTAVETKYTNIGKSFGDYIKNTAFQSLAIALVAIACYIYFAFSGTISGISPITFGLITLIALLHDVIISTGLYIISGNIFPDLQIDIFFVTALLTILGYSINDTIIIFDRLRENLRKYGGKKQKNGKQKDLYEIVNLSLTQTMKRSIYTSLTLFFVLLTILLFGPESLNGFVLVMIFGTIVGTYSSIFFAAPLLYEINKNKMLVPYKKQTQNIEDKIVV